jgi:hypothetical protein
MKNLGTPIQSLIFGVAVALAAWLLSPYLPGNQHCSVASHAVGTLSGEGRY